MIGSLLMASYHWIKLYHEILHDPKMGRLPDRVWRRCIECFLLAGENGRDGVLPCIADMAWKLRLSDEELLDDLETLASVGIVHQDQDAWIVTHFEDRQAPMDDAERKRRQRERDRKEEYYCHEPVTEDVTTTVTEPVTNRDTDKIRIDIDKRREDGDNAADAAPPAPAPPQNGKDPPKTRAPALTAGQQGVLDLFGAKRFRTVAQRDAVLDMEQKHGTAKLLECARWAAEKGMTLGGSIQPMRSALPDWGKPKQSRASPGHANEPASWPAIREWMQEEGIEWQAKEP